MLDHNTTTSPTNQPSPSRGQQPNASYQTSVVAQHHHHHHELDDPTSLRMFRDPDLVPTSGNVMIGAMGVEGSSKEPNSIAEVIPVCTRVTFRIGLFFWALRLLAAIACLAGGIALLRSIAGFPFSKCALLYGVGVAAVVYGAVVIVYTIASGVYVKKSREIFFDFGIPSPGYDAQPRWKVVLLAIAHVLVPFITLLIAIALCIGSWVLFTLSVQVPSLTADHGGAGSSLKNGSVRLWRDSNGLLYVKANSQLDALFGQGFAHAQDRLWQMEFMRLAAQGRLAEFLGSAALKFDKQTRILGFKQAGQQMYNGASAKAKAMMQSYVDGINFYLKTEQKRPPEFLFMSEKLLFYHEPEPFTPLDVCYAARVLQWQLSLNAAAEAERFMVFWNTNRSYAQVDELYVNFTNASNTIMSAADLGINEADCQASRAREQQDSDVEARVYDGYMSALRSQYNGNGRVFPSGRAFSAMSVDTDVPAAAVRPIEAKPSSKRRELNLMSLKRSRASNAWSGRAAGANTAAVGASDPHLEIDLPSVWYWSNLTFPDDNGVPYYAAGVGMSGIPGVHVGKTSYYSWGITMSMTDLEDLFLLVPDPANPSTRYMVNGTSIPYTTRTEVIKVSGSSDVTLTVQMSIYGPVATEAFDLPSQLKFAASGRPLISDNTTADALMSMMSPTVQSVLDMQTNVLPFFESPGLSIAIQDNTGAIGWGMTGHHYLRAIGHTGKYPTLGNGSFDYRGSIPYAALPVLYQAPSSTTATYVSCANQKIAPDGYPYTLGYDYEWSWRGARIQSLLSGNTSSLSDVNWHRTIQTDTRSSVWFDDFLPFVNGSSAESAAFRARLSTSGNAMLNQLVGSWDGYAARGSKLTTRFMFYLRAVYALPSDAIMALRNADFLHSYYWNPHNRYVNRLMYNPSSLMLQQCQSRASALASSPPSGSATWCTLFLAQQWNAVADIPDSSLPIWGVDANAVIGRHLMLHETIVECLFDRTHYKNGDFTTINVADFSGAMDGSFTTKYASSMRQLYDWTTQSMWLALPGGNSGNPYSQFYQSLWENYFNDAYVMLGGTMTQIVSAASQVLSP